jgi:hypothetical protein
MRYRLYIYIIFLFVAHDSYAQLSSDIFLGGSNDGFGYQSGVGTMADSCYFTGNVLPDSLLACLVDSVELNASELFAENYLWSTGDTTPVIWADSTSWYFITVSRGTCTKTDSIYVWLPVAPEINAAVQDASSPFTEDGSISAELIAGEAPFSYLWPDGTESADLNEVPSGEYVLQVQDVATCLYTFPIYIGFDTCYDKYANLPDDTITICLGDSVMIDNAYDSPGSYAWSTGETSTEIWTSTAGVYSLSLSWPGCLSTTDSVVVLNSNLITGVIDMTPTANYIYPDGTLTFMQTTGDSVLAFSWSNGDETASATGLAPGSYYLTVTDIHGCSFLFSDSVTSADCYDYYISLGPDQFACTGDALSVDAVGTADGEFTWSDGSTGLTAYGTVPDTIMLTVTDSTCMFTDTVLFLPTELPNMLINITQASRPINLDGAISISFLDVDSEDYTIVWSTGSTSFSISGLAYGTYYYTLTDSAGCIFNEEVYVPFNPCYTPYGIYISDTTNTSFTVSWTGPTAANYIASYKNITTGGGFISIPVPSGTTSVTIPASLGNVMKYRIKYTCDGVTSQSPLINFVMPADSVLRESRELPVTIYPNPATDWLHMICMDCTGQYVIIDRNGRIALQGMLDETLTQYNLQVAELPAGLYTLQVVLPQETMYFPFVRME